MSMEQVDKDIEVGKTNKQDLIEPNYPYAENMNATGVASLNNSHHYPHYFKPVKKYTHIDVYRVLDLFEVHNPAVQHATKKLLCSGNRGVKNFEKDIKEARDSLNRCLQMIQENKESSND